MVGVACIQRTDRMKSVLCFYGEKTYSSSPQPPLLDEVGDPFCNHHCGRVCIARGNSWHNAGVRHAQAVDALHLEKIMRNEHT